MAEEWRWSMGDEEQDDGFWIEATMDDSGEILMLQMHTGFTETQEVRLYLEEFDDLVASVGRMRKQREKDRTAFRDQLRLKAWKQEV